MLAIIRNQLQDDIDLKLVEVGGAYSWVDLLTGLLQGGLYDCPESAMRALERMYDYGGTTVLFREAA